MIVLLRPICWLTAHVWRWHPLPYDTGKWAYCDRCGVETEARHPDPRFQ